MSALLTVSNKGDFELFQDGKPLEFTREGGNYVAQVREEENGEVKFTVLRRSEFCMRAWFFWCALYWIIGFFGIFTKRYARATARVTSEICIQPGHGGKIEMQLHTPPIRIRDGENIPAFDFRSSVIIACEDWCFRPDRVAARRRKIYTWLFNVILRIVGLALCVWALSGL